MVLLPTGNVTMNKIYAGGFALILIVLGVWQYTSMAEKLGKSEQANSTLKKAVEDSEKEREKLKAVAKLDAATVAKVSKEKNTLNTYALKKAHELEILKNENAEIKKWAINNMPHVLAGKLFDLPDNDNANGLYISADGSINTDGGTEVEIQNEALYNYSNDLKVALRSCNADKTGLREWYDNAGVILQ